MNLLTGLKSVVEHHVAGTILARYAVLNFVKDEFEYKMSYNNSLSIIFFMNFCWDRK